ncbi:MAG TPA: hypothetical protein VGR73_17105 [Bryobacteraceae bacterium]|nr:hypothetical protein [Bryobacteraceae bacterium]
MPTNSPLALLSLWCDLWCNKHLPASDPTTETRRARWDTLLLFTALFAILAAARLCHTDILWSDEDYHQAAALQVLHGKALYRDLWYDKPPLNVAVYLLFGASGGALLRLASAVYALLVCWSAFLFASRVWSRREGRIAASLAAFFLIFYFPAAAITLEPDTLMILPQLWAVNFAWQRRFFAAGLVTGVAALLNVKGVFVLAACVTFEWTEIGWLVLGFLIPNVAGFAWLASQGELSGYAEQVWRWGLLYTGSGATLTGGLARAAGWAGFHAALLLAAVLCWWEERASRMRFIGWTIISLGASAIGGRFLPRYMEQLLPPLIVAASRGFTLAGALSNVGRRRVLEAALGAALAIPLARFGPRYVLLAAETLQGKPHEWIDTAMDRDSRAAARILSNQLRFVPAAPGSIPAPTLFVWGYRPNIFVYTGFVAASRFWDSQPLTGVPADRHLLDERPVDAAWAAENRAELARSRPDFIADGLSLYNPRLDIHRYPDLAQWLAAYCEVGRTTGTILYRRCDRR